MTAPALSFLRAARPTDVEEIARLVRARCAHDGEPSEHVAPGFFLEHIFGPKRALTAIVVDREALSADDNGLGGLVLFHPAYEAVYATHGSCVMELFVDPDLRRQGLARALLADAARATKADGGTYLWWTSSAANHVARRFYDEIADILNDQSVFYAVTRQTFERLCSER
ncbi:MAG: GNAT family N-acetyltransferase [Pseudomonadota bacterium]